MTHTNLSLQEKLGRLFFIGLPTPYLDDETKQVLETIRPGSIILFARNVESPEQVRRYVDDINQFLGFEPVFCIDQEGGIVSRLRKGFAVAPGALATAATGDPNNAKIIGHVLGSELRTLGINWNLAPVVDVNSLPLNPGIGVRSYGDTPEQVMAYANAFIEGLQKSGVCSCIKHFPGLGRVNVDPHLERPEVHVSKQELFLEELRPYIEMKADAIMPSHAFYSALQTIKEPASLSKEVLTDFARKELGFQGLFVADALTMGGVTNTVTPVDAAIKALDAGMDYLSFCHDSKEQMEVFEGAFASLKDSSHLQVRLEESYIRVNAFMDYAQRGILEKAETQKTLPLETVGSKEHTSLMHDITLKGIAKKVIDGEKSTPEAVDYLQNLDAIYSAILTRPVEAEEGPEENEPPFIARTLAEKLNISFYAFPVDLEDAMVEELTSTVQENAKILIFTEDALMHPNQKKLLVQLCKKTKNHIVVALRNPYDVWLPEIQTAFMSYGYERISQLALLEVLSGKACAKGSFPFKNPLT